MKNFTRVLTGVVAAAGSTAVVTIAGLTSAHAQPVDYSTLPVHPNGVTDSNAWIPGATVLNPAGQPGVETTFAHRDGSRSITDRVQVYDNPEAAKAAMAANTTGEPVASPFTKNVPVGEGGVLTTGTSQDGSKSVGTLQFTNGNTLTQVRFEGPPGDPVPEDVATQYGQSQDAANQQMLNGG